MTKSKAGMIAPYQLFFIIFISRVVVTLTYIQNVSVGRLSSDLVISLIASFVLTIIICVPAYLCAVKGKNPFSIRWIAILYAIYFVYISAINVSRISYFASSRLNTGFSMAFFIAAILICACYASIMGLEGLGRFGTFCAVILVMTVVVVTVFNFRNVCLINAFPIFQNTRASMVENCILFTSNSVEPAIFLALSDKVNGERKKPLFLGITAAYAVIILLIIMCQLVMGSATDLQAFPVFTLFQLASIGSMSRLDIFHTAFWVLAIFLKVAVSILSASLCVKKYKHSTKCVVITALSGVASMAITLIAVSDMISITKIVSIVMFAVYCLIIPVVTLVFSKKKSRVDGVE